MIALIEEAKKCLDHKLFIAGISIVLTFPDICGKVEFAGTELKGRESYIGWFDKFVYENNYKYQEVHDGPFKNIQLSGKECYQLRCSLLHNGETHVNTNKDPRVRVTEFWLVFKPTDEFGLTNHHDVAIFTDTENNKPDNMVRIDVAEFISIMCDAATKYYQSKYANEFIDIRKNIIDMEEVYRIRDSVKASIK